MKNRDKKFGNSSEENTPFNDDPIIQPRDESDNQNESVQPVEALLRKKESTLPSESSLSYSRHANARNDDRNAWTGTYVLKSMIRYKWSIILIFILIASPLLALIWTQIIPKYQARAEIRVRPIIPYLVYQTEDSGMIPLYNSFLNSQVSIIKSQIVLQRVIERPDIKNTGWYRTPNNSLVSKLVGNKMSHLERLRDDLSVRPRKQTEFVDVSFIADNKEEAKDIVDAVMEEYLKYDKEKSDSTQNQLYDQLVDEYDKLKNDISLKESDIQFRLNSLGTSSPQELVSSQRLNIVQLQQQLSEVQQNIDILKWDQKKLEELIESNAIADSNSDSNNVIVNMSKQRMYYDDSEWRSLDRDVRTIQFQMDTSQFTEDHPEWKRMQERLDFAKKELSLRESQIDDQRESMPDSIITSTGVQGPNYQDQLMSIKYQIERSKKEEELINDNLIEKQKEFDKLFESVQLLEKDISELEYQKELYDAVRLRLEQKKMERNVSGSIERVSPAYASSKYYNDRRIVFSVMVLCLAVGLSFGIAFLRATMNQVIFASKDLPLSTRVPHLGSLPLIQLKNPLGKTLGEEIERNQVHLFESVRVIRTKLLLQLNEQDSSTVLISSSVAGTGKSSFTKVLGKYLAKTGKSVLMVDMDFYKKTLSKRFGLTNKSGIMNYLNSKSLDFTGICQTEIPNLSILPAGKQSYDNVVFEGIDNGFFGTYFDELKKRYSVIILDSSPVLPRADTVIMSHHVNGVILVERELLSRRENIINSIDRIGSSGGNIWGVVLVGSSDYETYGNYSGYYET